MCDVAHPLLPDRQSLWWPRPSEVLVVRRQERPVVYETTHRTIMKRKRPYLNDAREIQSAHDATTPSQQRWLEQLPHGAAKVGMQTNYDQVLQVMLKSLTHGNQICFTY